MQRAARDERIFVLGGGGHASDVLNVIERLGLLSRVAGCLDDDPDPRRMRLWNVTWLGVLSGGHLESGMFVLGVGMPSLKAWVLDSVDTGNATPVALIDPGATLGHGAEIQPGAVVLAAASVSAHVTLGMHSHVGQNCSIGHDAMVGELCSVMPGATIGGDCELAERVMVGANAAVNQGISIGAGARVGSGAVVTRDVPSGVTVVGSPARQLDLA